jgi:hypothetical protein
VHWRSAQSIRDIVVTAAGSLTVPGSSKKVLIFTTTKEYFDPGVVGVVHRSNGLKLKWIDGNGYLAIRLLDGEINFL